MVSRGDAGSSWVPPGTAVIHESPGPLRPSELPSSASLHPTWGPSSETSQEQVRPRAAGVGPGSSSPKAWGGPESLYFGPTPPSWSPECPVSFPHPHALHHAVVSLLLDPRVLGKLRLGSEAGDGDNRTGLWPEPRSAQADQGCGTEPVCPPSTAGGPRAGPPPVPSSPGAGSSPNTRKVRSWLSSKCKSNMCSKI